MFWGCCWEVDNFRIVKAQAVRFHIFGESKVEMDWVMTEAKLSKHKSERSQPCKSKGYSAMNCSCSAVTSEHHILTTNRWEVPNHDELREYTFDCAGRLVRSDSTVRGISIYGWDKAGNRRLESINGQESWSDFNGLNQLTEKREANRTVTYEYDLKGNQVLEREVRPNRSVSERIFTYNVDNRLTEVAQRTTSGNRVTENVINRNVFRGDGQRIQRDMLKYVYRDGAVLYTTGGGSNWIANFYYRAPNSDIMAIRHDTNFTTVSSTITTDIRGSTLSIFDDSRGLRGGFRYSDFGITQRVGWCDQNIDVAYTGGIWDEATGLYYLNARFYNPVDARFLQIDVARNGGDLRATLSLYGYTEDDTINKVDPTGYASRRVLSVPWFRQRTGAWCMSACAQMILRFFTRRTHNQAALHLAATGNNHQNRGMTMRQLQRLLRSRGLRANMVYGSLTFRQVRANINNGRVMVAGGFSGRTWPHAVVVRGFEQRHGRNDLFINDPMPRNRGSHRTVGHVNFRDRFGHRDDRSGMNWSVTLVVSRR